MRFFKLNKNYSFNWKYVLGEIFLIFIGINLAIWFNNWNSSKEAHRNKLAAIEKIAGEIKDNLEEIEGVLDQNMNVVTAYSDYEPLFGGGTSDVIAKVSQMNALQKKHPRFFRITDSTKAKEDSYHYKGKTYVQLELPDLSDIAWETTRAINVTTEFNYECLYGLESMYNLQRRVQIEIDKSGEALQKGKLKELMNIINFSNQLIELLTETYEEALANVDECR